MPTRPFFFKTVLIFFCFPFLLQSQVTVESDSLLMIGKTDYSSDFFRDRLLHNSFASFVDNYNDFVIYQTTTHGDFHVPDQTLMSIQGNSYRWNKYYLDDFRIDDRVSPGSYLYEQDLFKHSFTIDIYNSKIKYDSDDVVDNSLLLRYNHGDVGGISPGTEWFFNLFHKTALQTIHKPINARRNMSGQGVAVLDFTLPFKGKTLKQHLYVDIGQRELVAFDYSTDNWAFYENYAKVELGGQLPTAEGGVFDDLNYAFAFSTRDNFNHELYYAENETAVNDKYSLSIYGKHATDNSSLNTGVSIVRHSIEHNDPDFTRNYMDIDGESLSPYYTDVNTTEISNFTAYDLKLNDAIKFAAEGYNSIIFSTAQNKNSTNAIYFESLVSPEDDSWMEDEDPYYTSLYLYDWTSESFATGLLENSAGFFYDKKLSSSLIFKASASATIDALLLKDKSVIRPNWEAELMMNWQPNEHFSMGVNFSRKRVPFHYDMAKYLSNDYMHGDEYYWQDANNDKEFQEDERSSYLTSSGGEYRHVDDNIQQPSYFMFDWPIIISMGRKHTFSIVSTYKKFYNQWQTALVGDAEDYGTYERDNGQDIFYLNNGQQFQYSINSGNSAGMDLDQSMSFLTNTPFSLTNIMKYSYKSEKAFFSISWVSQFMMNVATLGNSPQENNVEIFSDAMANPNTQIKSVGRPQQDRGYVARALYGYKFNENWKASFLFKFIDGQPFAKYDTRLKTDDDGNTQIASRRYLNNSISPLYEGWGHREDMGFNTELKVAYTLYFKETNVEINLAGYNLIDFGYELTSNGFDVPKERQRTSIELNAPRGLMITAKVVL